MNDQHTTADQNSQPTPVSREEAAILARFARRARKVASNTSRSLSQGTFVAL